MNFPWGPLYNHKGQFLSSFSDVRFGDRLEVNYYSDSNHIVTQPAVQSAVVRDISRWVAEVVVANAHAGQVCTEAAAPVVANAGG